MIRFSQDIFRSFLIYVAHVVFVYVTQRSCSNSKYLWWQ